MAHTLTYHEMTQSLMKLWANASDVAAKLKFIWIISGAILIAFGFGFKTPSSQFAEIRATQDTFRIRLDNYGTSKESDEVLIKALSIAQCIDRLSKGNEGRRELQLMQMPCGELLGNVK